MKDTVVIFNPTARGARAKRLRAQVESITRGATLCATSHSGEAELLARNAAAEGYEKVVAAGGDGTVNEIVNGIAGKNVALGLLPIGTMNVFRDRAWTANERFAAMLGDHPGESDAARGPAAGQRQTLRPTGGGWP